MRGWLRNLNRWMSAQKLVRNSILLISAEMVAKALGMVFFALVARFLGAKELGLYAFALALANFRRWETETSGQMLRVPGFGPRRPAIGQRRRLRVLDG